MGPPLVQVAVIVRVPLFWIPVNVKVALCEPAGIVIGLCGRNTPGWPLFESVNLSADGEVVGFPDASTIVSVRGAVGIRIVPVAGPVSRTPAAGPATKATLTGPPNAVPPSLAVTFAMPTAVADLSATT